jgi:hypothetical protein
MRRPRFIEVKPCQKSSALQWPAQSNYHLKAEGVLKPQNHDRGRGDCLYQPPIQIARSHEQALLASSVLFRAVASSLTIDLSIERHFRAALLAKVPHTKAGNS